MAASEVPGVADMAGGFAGGISEVLSGKKNMSKGIKVDILEKSTKIDVNIIAQESKKSEKKAEVAEKSEVKKEAKKEEKKDEKKDTAKKVVTKKAPAKKNAKK